MNSSRTILLSKIFALVLCVGLVAGCDPKNEPRWEHEPAHTWKGTSTPDREDVQSSDFSKPDIKAMYATVKNAEGDLTEKILKPLSAFVLNRKFVESPLYRTVRLAQMLNVFNAAFVKEFAKQPRSAAFAQIKDDYYKTVFAGCTADLRSGCMNAELFSADGRFTEIMTLFARELDPAMDEQLKQYKSPKECVKNQKCRQIVEERYRRLGMGVFKSNRYQDAQFAFAYIKYAAVFSADLEFLKTQPVQKNGPISMSASYLAQAHGAIFETIIAKYKAADVNSDEFRAFVESFNPWRFSHKNTDAFQLGTAVIFGLGSQCCLYTDSSKTKLSKSVSDAIEESQTQKDPDAFGPSFHQIVEEIVKNHGDQKDPGRLFEKLNMADTFARVGSEKSSFYDEYFFMIDRLFRGHLSSDEVEMMLKSTNPERTRIEFPKRIADYIKVNLLYMVIKTNIKMAEIYHANIPSNEILKEAISKSRVLTDQWHEVQTQIDLLDKLMNSYFRERLLTSAEFQHTYDLVRAVNRNVHYISVFPQMFVMNYFLTKMNTTTTFMTYWNEPMEIKAESILKDFLNLIRYKSPWFLFGKDPEQRDPLTQLFSLEYLMSTETLNYFVSNDKDNTATSERSKFFDTIFNRYFNDEVVYLKNQLIEYKQETLDNPTFATAKRICTYETQGGQPQTQHIDFTNLGHYTYSGLNKQKVNSALSNFLHYQSTMVERLLVQTEHSRTLMNTMIKIVEGDLLRTHAIAKAGDPHPDLDSARDMMKQVDQAQAELIKIFVGNHETYFDCAMRLREIERRRANRLYDEEREFLGGIYDKLNEIAAIQDPKARQAKIDQENSTYFVDKNGFKFDQIQGTGTSYRYSKYDLFRRIAHNLEMDIFTQPTKKEVANYDPSSLKEYVRSRPVVVDIPPGLARDPMVEDGTSHPLQYLGDSPQARQAFISQGMTYLNGQAGNYVEWNGEMEQDLSQFHYLTTLEQIYLLPKVEGTGNVELTADAVINAYIKVVASLALDQYDVEYTQLFQRYGRYPLKDDNYRDERARLFEADGLTQLPFFFSLMKDMVDLSKIAATTDGPVGEARDLARRYHSLQAFVFAPSGVVPETIRKTYGDSAHWRMNRVSEIYRRIVKRAEHANSVADLDPRLTNPIYLAGDRLVSWYQPKVKNLIEPQQVQDLKYLISIFDQNTGDFYGTREKVTGP